jgi:hypothetical protein
VIPIATSSRQVSRSVLTTPFVCGSQASVTSNSRIGNTFNRGCCSAVKVCLQKFEIFEIRHVGRAVRKNAGLTPLKRNRHSEFTDRATQSRRVRKPMREESGK